MNSSYPHSLLPEVYGYQTLTTETEVVYQVSEFYTPGYERGLHYKDPTLGIKWPLAVAEISEKDANWPLLLKPVGVGVEFARNYRN